MADLVIFIRDCTKSNCGCFYDGPRLKNRERCQVNEMCDMGGWLSATFVILQEKRSDKKTCG